MPTICPNCFRTVRESSKYCGYCGFVLDSAAGGNSAVADAASQGETQTKPGTAARPRSKPTRASIRRTILILLIVILFLVLIFAFVSHYWFPLFAMVSSIRLI